MARNQRPVNSYVSFFKRCSQIMYAHSEYYTLTHTHRLPTEGQHLRRPLRHHLPSKQSQNTHMHRNVRNPPDNVDDCCWFCHRVSHGSEWREQNTHSPCLTFVMCPDLLRKHASIRLILSYHSHVYAHLSHAHFHKRTLSIGAHDSADTLH